MEPKRNSRTQRDHGKNSIHINTALLFMLFLCVFSSLLFISLRSCIHTLYAKHHSYTRACSSSSIRNIHMHTHTHSHEYNKNTLIHHHQHHRRRRHVCMEQQQQHRDTNHLNSFNEFFALIISLVATAQHSTARIHVYTMECIHTHTHTQ